MYQDPLQTCTPSAGSSLLVTFKSEGMAYAIPSLVRITSMNQQVKSVLVVISTCQNSGCSDMELLDD